MEYITVQEFPLTIPPIFSSTLVFPPSISRLSLQTLQPLAYIATSDILTSGVYGLRHREHAYSRMHLVGPIVLPYAATACKQCD